MRTFSRTTQFKKDVKLAGKRGQNLEKLKAVLESNGFKLSDVANAKVFLVADPATGKMDFAGMNKAFMTFFGTPANPVKPSRITVQIAALAGPGSLVDFSTTNGGVLFTNSDGFLQTKYTAIRQSAGYLYFFGDGSVSVASNVSASEELESCCARKAIPDCLSCTL